MLNRTNTIVMAFRKKRINDVEKLKEQKQKKRNENIQKKIENIKVWFPIFSPQPLFPFFVTSSHSESFLSFVFSSYSYYLSGQKS